MTDSVNCKNEDDVHCMADDNNDCVLHILGDPRCARTQIAEAHVLERALEAFQGKVYSIVREAFAHLDDHDGVFVYAHAGPSRQTPRTVEIYAKLSDAARATGAVDAHFDAYTAAADLLVESETLDPRQDTIIYEVNGVPERAVRVDLVLADDGPIESPSSPAASSPSPAEPPASPSSSRVLPVEPWITTTLPDDPIERLREIADRHCADFRYEVPTGYSLLQSESLDVIWCDRTGALAVCVDDDMGAVRVYEPEEMTASRPTGTTYDRYVANEVARPSVSEIAKAFLIDKTVRAEGFLLEELQVVLQEAGVEVVLPDLEAGFNTDRMREAGVFLKNLCTGRWYFNPELYKE